MIQPNQIKPKTMVVGSNNALCGVVDRLEGKSTIKLVKDDDGQHHYIPLSWVKSIDDKVHLDRTSSDVKKEWTTTMPK